MNMLAWRTLFAVLRWIGILYCLALVHGCSSLEPSVGTDSAKPDETLAKGVNSGDPEAVRPAQVSDTKDGALELFPTVLTTAVMPAGWEKWILHPLKRKTDYGWKKDRKGVYLEAKSHASASGLIKRLDIDPKSLPYLQFSWMVDGLLEGADVGDRAFEDSPVRVVLAFDGDKSTLPMKELAFMERVKTFTGHDLPYASLTYVWDNKRPLNTIVPNPHTGRIQKLVASSGPSGIRSWQMHQRNILNDYRAAYGKEPGKLIAIAVMTDTDNTKTYAQARYRGLVLSKAEPTVGVTSQSE
jgi:Protein of unknown function (DUF3047)